MSVSDGANSFAPSLKSLGGIISHPIDLVGGFRLSSACTVSVLVILQKENFSALVACKVICDINNTEVAAEIVFTK